MSYEHLSCVKITRGNRWSCLLFNLFVCAYPHTSMRASLHMLSLTRLLFSVKLFINKDTVFFLLKLSGLVMATDLITIWVKLSRGRQKGTDQNASQPFLFLIQRNTFREPECRAPPLQAQVTQSWAWTQMFKPCHLNLLWLTALASLSSQVKSEDDKCHLWAGFQAC